MWYNNNFQKCCQMNLLQTVFMPQHFSWMLLLLELLLLLLLLYVFISYLYRGASWPHIYKRIGLRVFASASRERGFWKGFPGFPKVFQGRSSTKGLPRRSQGLSRRPPGLPRRPRGLPRRPQSLPKAFPKDPPRRSKRFPRIFKKY